MRYGIFSDAHSNIEALDAVINGYAGESIDRYLCVGDLVGYGANPNECVDRVRGLSAVSIAGNHDWACIGKLSTDYFNPYAREAVEWTAKLLDGPHVRYLESLQLIFQEDDLTLVHGTLDEPAAFHYCLDEDGARDTFNVLAERICFVGHSHVAGIFIRDAKGKIRYTTQTPIVLQPGYSYVVNVGSVGQPRDGDHRASFCVYDSSESSVAIQRVGYDVALARKKIIHAGLPEMLGDRLLTGR